MARVLTRIATLVSRSLPVHPSPAISASIEWWPVEVLTVPSTLSPTSHLPIFFSCSHMRGFHMSFPLLDPGPFSSFFAPFRGFRKMRRRQAARKLVPEEKKLELRVNVSIEEGMSDDHEVVNIAEMLKLDAPMAMKMAFDGLKELECRAQGSSMDDISIYEQIVLSILLCNDEMITKLNKECKGVDSPIEVLARIQHVQELGIPILMLGDIVISAEVASRQAEERGCTLLDVIRNLMMQGLLDLLGYDRRSDETVAEMEKLEELVLRSLGWKGRGLATGTYNVVPCGFQSQIDDGKMSSAQKKARNLRFYRPKFSYIFCDMGGTLLNSQGQVSTKTAVALREALCRGVKIVIATGKTRPAAITALKMFDLDGKNGIVSEVSPGIFLQGLLVYGRQGREIHRRNLDQSVCREALLYSLEHEVPVIAFCQDRCLTLFDHPLLDSLHAIYPEPKAEVITSVEHLLAAADIQKIIFLDAAEGVSSVLRPHWEEATDGRAVVVQAHPHILEIIPAGASKADGVRVLIDHLGISAKEIMAIGDGENDVEMLKIASLGVALGNGSEKAKAVADVIGATNDEDGVAMAIYQYAF